MEKRIITGVTLAMTTTVIWAGTFIIARVVVGEISPTLMAATRWIIAFAILCTFMIPTVKKEWPIAIKFLPQIFFASLLGIASYPLFIYFAAETTSTMNISLIAVTSPVFIVFICACLGEKQSFHTWAGCILALFGSFYLVIDGNINRMLDIKFAFGDLLMLIAAVCFAMYSILLRNPPKGLSSGTIMTLMVFFTVVLLTPYAIWEISQPDVLFNVNATVIFAILFSAVVISIISWWSWNIALTTAGPALCGMIYYCMPLWGGILGYIVLGENITSVHYISGVMIIGGIIWSSRGSKSKPKPIQKDAA